VKVTKEIVLVHAMATLIEINVVSVTVMVSQKASAIVMVTKQIVIMFVEVPLELIFVMYVTVQELLLLSVTAIIKFLIVLASAVDQL